MSFSDIVTRFTRAVEGNDPQGLADLFLPDGSYVDGFYGAFTGRAAIAGMLRDHFWGHAKAFRWQMLDPVCDGGTGYVRWVFSYTSVLPESAGRRVVFEGMSRFELQGAMIRRYSEVFDRGVAMVQLGFPPERIAKALGRAAERQNAKPECRPHLDAARTEARSSGA